MKISITRNTGWIGFAVRLKVFINGVEMVRMANSATQFLDIPLQEGDTAILTVKSIRSSNIQIQEGDQVLIETNPAYMICLSIAMALLIISMFLRYSSNMASIILSFAASGLFISALFMQQFTLSKINRP
ncbi:hypothetical protein EII38_07265 [Streptococcus minor]|uniref:Uncharacterized protein n=1 Tax=Streptococcus minor TaxID=229549 RepID=A0A3P1VA98_9STRE|nr:hypothetical protein [Streptococcus minor]RRD31069.1 hypothetical protein EII38_07265 [Streptococcus minor]